MTEDGEGIERADPRRQSGRIAALPGRFASAEDAVRDRVSRPNLFPTGSLICLP